MILHALYDISNLSDHIKTVRKMIEVIHEMNISSNTKNMTRPFQFLIS